MCILSIKDITDETKNVYKNSVRLCYSFLYTVESEPSVYVFYSMLYVLYVHAPMQMRIRRWARETRDPPSPPPPQSTAHRPRAALRTPVLKASKAIQAA